LREGSERELTAKLAEVDLENDASKRLKSEPVVSSHGALSGVRVENITPEWSERLRLPSSTRGVVVAEVDPDSNAAAAGLRPGFVIEEVAKQPITSVNDFNEAIQQADKKEVLLRVRRGSDGRSSYVIVKSEE
jgi:serine protease Do